MNQKSLLFRIAIVTAITLSALTLPWWVPMVSVVVSAFYFRWFVEGIVIGALMDLLYSSGGQTVLGSHQIFLLGGLAIVAISIVLRSALKFY